MSFWLCVYLIDCNAICAPIRLCVCESANLFESLYKCLQLPMWLSISKWAKTPTATTFFRATQLNTAPHRTSKNRAHCFDIAGKAHTMTFGPKAPVQFMSFLHPTSLTHLRVRASASLCMWAIPFFRSSSLSASPLFAVSIWWGDEKLNLRKQRNIIWALKSWVLKYHRLKLWNITSWGVDLVHQNMAVKIKKLDSEGTCSPFLDSRSEATCKSLASLRVNYAGWIIGYRLSHAIT